jgi:hypothetical protein
MWASYPVTSPRTIRNRSDCSSYSAVVDQPRWIRSRAGQRQGYGSCVCRSEIDPIPVNTRASRRLRCRPVHTRAARKTTHRPPPMADRQYQHASSGSDRCTVCGPRVGPKQTCRFVSSQDVHPALGSGRSTGTRRFRCRPTATGAKPETSRLPPPRDRSARVQSTPAARRMMRRLIGPDRSVAARPKARTARSGSGRRANSRCRPSRAALMARFSPLRPRS